MKAHEILREQFEEKRREGYSLRALARDLDISPAFLSNVFHGKKKIPSSFLPRLIAALDIDSETVLEIQRQLSPEQILAQDLFKRTEASLKWKIGSPKKMSALRQWFYLPIMEITRCSDYDGSAEYIARRLGLSQSAVEIALRELSAMGLVEERDGKLVKSTERMRLASSRSRPEIRSFHKQMLVKAKEELDLDNPEDFVRRLIFGITVTASPERIALAKKMLSDALYDIANFLADDDQGSEVYHLAAQLFPLTKGK